MIDNINRFTKGEVEYSVYIDGELSSHYTLNTISDQHKDSIIYSLLNQDYVYFLGVSDSATVTDPANIWNDTYFGSTKEKFDNLDIGSATVTTNTSVKIPWVVFNNNFNGKTIRKLALLTSLERLVAEVTLDTPVNKTSSVYISGSWTLTF